MTDPYTYTAKPTGRPYSFSNPQGREQYDQASIIYDDANVFYDGIDESAYTSVAKPTGTPYTLVSKPIL